MDDLGFIAASYVLSLGGTAWLAFSFLRRARKMDKQIDPKDKPWT
jgi:hypothetical protein